jgi:hypothetical protein
MHDINKQQGASTPLVVIFIAMTAIVLTIAFKLYPPFFEHWQIESVIDSFEEDSGLGDLGLDEIIRRFDKRLLTNNVRSFNSEESSFLELEDGLLTISVDYEVRVPMYRNVDAVIKFERTLERQL